MRGSALLIGCLLTIGTALLPAEIIIKQEKDGRLVISERTTNPIIRRLNALKRKVKTASSATTSVGPVVYRKRIQTLCQKHSLRDDLAYAVAKAESSFNPYAISHKGAMGMMQLMHGTAQLYGVLNPFDVDENLEAGIRHLKYLYGKYRFNLVLTLAAYNAGEEAVKKYGGVPPYKETKQYIRRVLSYMNLGHLYREGGLKLTRSRFYKYVNTDGRIVISDALPRDQVGRVEIIE